MSSSTVLCAPRIALPCGGGAVGDAATAKRLSRFLLERGKEEERLRALGLLGRAPAGVAPRYSRTAHELVSRESCSRDGEKGVGCGVGWGWVGVGGGGGGGGGALWR